MYDHMLSRQWGLQQTSNDAARAAMVRQHQRSNQGTSRQMHPILAAIVSIFTK